MSINLDERKLQEVALALLALSRHSTHGVERVWKTLDWDLTDALHDNGWIGDPKSKAKSVELTPEGSRLAEEFLRRHFSTDG